MSPTHNKLLRQALGYALDRKRYAETALLGTSEPRSLPWRKTSLAFDASKQNYFTFDPERARSLIGQAGLSNVELDFVYQSAAATNLSLAQIYQGDLAALGVKLNLVPVDGPTFLDTVNKLSYRGLTGPASFNSSLEPSTGLLSIEPDANKRRQLYALDAHEGLVPAALWL